jgi:hypothetical protein
MSNIIFNNIDVTFPIAGQDNPSKGFRDNWGYIQNALSIAKSEISALESTALLKHSLTSNTTKVENNLGGSSIINGSYRAFYGTSHITTQAAETIYVNVANGDVQQVNLTASANITFIGWPSLGTQYVKVRLHVNNVQPSSLTVNNITSQQTASVKKEADLFPSPFTVLTNKQLVIEAWSFNCGGTVFLKYLGEYLGESVE